MLEEEAELEKEFYGSNIEPTDEKQKADNPIPNVDTFEDDDLIDEVDSPTDPKLETEDHQDSKDEDADQKKQNRQSYKKRYVNYKTATDKTIYSLRTEITRLLTIVDQRNKTVDELSSRVADLLNRGKDPYAEIITQQDIDTIGPEAIDIIKKANKKATESALSPLQAELNAMKARELESRQKLSLEREKTEYNLFIADLGRLVPEYGALNIDPNFHKFMDGLDPSTGDTKLKSFLLAEKYKDAERVADFFNEFKASVQPPKSKKEMLEDKVTPDSSSASSTPSSNNKDTISIEFVDKFFADCNKGKYRKSPKEAEEIEARITKAYLEGKISY